LVHQKVALGPASDGFICHVDKPQNRPSQHKQTQIRSYKITKFLDITYHTHMFVAPFYLSYLWALGGPHRPSPL